MILSNTQLDNPILIEPSPAHPTAQVEAACLRTLQLFIKPGQVTQLMAFDVREPAHHGPRNFGGYFDYDHLDLMASEAARFSGNARGVHFTLNPLRPDVLGRAPNRVQRVVKGQPACDRDVLDRKWLMIDADPLRAGVVSATDREKQNALTAMQDVVCLLRRSGYSSPVIADSGNGFHLYFRVNLPATDKIPRRVLRSLAAQFDSDAVKIDTSVASASQLTRLYGTLTAKGDSTDDRPHRISRILEVPENIVPNDVMVLSRVIQPSQPERSEGATAAPPQACSGAKSYLAAMPPSVSGQNGHNRLFEAACRLVQGFNLEPATALPLLREYNQRAIPPWIEEDLLHKLDDADAQEDVRPRGYLLREGDWDVPDAPARKDVRQYEGLPVLPGPAFPTSIPDFIPAPCERSLEYLQVETDIERAPGRPKFDTTYYLYWQVLSAIYEQKVSPVVIPDAVIAAGIGGASPASGWRNRLVFRGHKIHSVKAAKRISRQVHKQLIAIAEELRQAIADDPAGQHENLSQRTEELLDRRQRITRRIPSEDCPAQCPLHGSNLTHDHFLLQPNEDVLGVLARFSTYSVDHVSEFDFDAKQDGENKTVLDSLIEANSLHRAYLPVQLFGQASGLSIRQIRMIQGLMREETRTATRGKRNAKNVELELIRGGRVKAVRGRGTINCPFLDQQQNYVAFGGNLTNHAGRGYQLIGKLDENLQKQGGWLRRFGYPASAEMEGDRVRHWVELMLADLAELAPCFDLVVGAVDRTNKWRSLDELQIMARASCHRSWLKTCSLRVFASEDYLVRWRHWFAKRLHFSFIPGGDWSQPPNSQPATTPRPTAESIKHQLLANKITGRQLSQRLGWTESRVSRQLSGKTKLSDDLVVTVQQWFSETDRIAQ